VAVVNLIAARLPTYVPRKRYEGECARWRGNRLAGTRRAGLLWAWDNGCGQIAGIIEASKSEADPIGYPQPLRQEARSIDRSSYSLG